MSRGKSHEGTSKTAKGSDEQPIFDKKNPRTILGASATGSSAEVIIQDHTNTGTTPEQTLTVADNTDKNSNSVQAKTHARARGFKAIRKPKRWVKITGVAAGSVALLAIVAAGGLGQFYKTRVMPGVYVAGINSGGKTSEEVRRQLKQQLGSVRISFKTESKVLNPTLEEIGYQSSIDKTLANAKNAKRNNGFFNKLLFWKRVDVPASVGMNNTLLNQYLETNIPEITQAPVDAQLQFDAKISKFIITEQSDGKVADSVSVKRQIQKNAYELTPVVIQTASIKKVPEITKAKLGGLLAPATNLTQQTITLTGLGYTYQAKPADIAAWITPTPQEDGSVKLVIDSAKIQSYVDGISKRISSIPVDRKILKDDTTGSEVVLQEGRDGTELAGKQELSEAIAAALKSGSGTTQAMNIQTAAFKTVNMSAYDKWIEVDLSEQRMRAYERITPVQNYLIASGTRGRDTPVGEFAIWLKTRKQTMQGGSKADGNFYSIPNVEWVSYFYKDYALHGAWWRKQFGYPASHGCVNMTNEQAKWLYEWAPIGTKVIVHQ